MSDKKLTPAEIAEKYPQHEKLLKISDASQAQGEFLDWLINEQKFVLARYETLEPTRSERLVHANPQIDQLLAQFHEIDYEALEAEKRAMIAEFQKHIEQERQPDLDA
jgi:hypothetical protein